MSGPERLLDEQSDVPAKSQEDIVRRSTQDDQQLNEAVLVAKEPAATVLDEEEIDPTQTARQEKVALDEEVVEPGEESFIHNPWGSSVLSLASVSRAMRKTKTPPKRRFTRNRILLFVGLVLVIIVLFVGGGFALLAHLAPQTNVQLVQPTPPTQPTQLVQKPMQTMMTPPPAMTPVMQPTLQDNFQRPDIQAGWGTASNGQAWQVTSPQRAASFSVVGNVGMITSPATQQGGLFYTATIGPTNTVEASVTFAMQFNALQLGVQQPANFGVLLRWQDADNYDKAYVDGAQLIILENRAGQQMMLARTVFPAVSGSAYTIRFRVQDQTLQAKAWLQGGAEPAGWQLFANSNLMAGQAGIRALLLPASTVQVTVFRVVTA